MLQMYVCSACTFTILQQDLATVYVRKFQWRILIRRLGLAERLYVRLCTSRYAWTPDQDSPLKNCVSFYWITTLQTKSL